MGLESATHINQLVATNPTSSDAKNQGDDHLRLIKSALVTDFANIGGAVTASHTELNYVDGVTSNIQTQLDSKLTGTLGTGVATFLATPSSANLRAALTDETGTGAAVFADTPTLVTPVLGTPGSGTLTNCTGLPVSTGIAGLGSGVATFLATPSSANLASAVTGETGSGALVFGTSPTLAGPTITDYVETTYAPSAGTAFTVDWANGTNQVFTSNGNITITLPSAVAGKGGTIHIKYGGTHTLTWAGGGTIRHPSATAPTATSVNGKRDIFSILSTDTSNTFVTVIGQNFAA